MSAFFLTCAVLGGGILLLQLIASLAGLGHHGIDDAHGSHLHADGLHLFSVRALAAGVAFFGVGGLAGLTTRLGLLLAIPLSLLFGSAALLGIAYATRAMLRLENDGSVEVEHAVGALATVYLSIPGGRAGLGKVHATVNNRMVEYQAVTSHREGLPTGARVLIVDVVDSDTVDVVPDPITLPHEAAANVLR